MPHRPGTLQRGALGALLCLAIGTCVLAVIRSLSVEYRFQRRAAEGRPPAPDPFVTPGEVEAPDLFKYPPIEAGLPESDRLPPGIAIRGGRIMRLKDKAEMVYVPSSSFMMGTQKGTLHGMYGVVTTRERFGITVSHVDNEMPYHAVEVSGFLMDKYEVTNAQFRQFVAATGYVTTAEKTGASRVNLDHEPERPWEWAKVEGAHWRQPFGPGQPATEPDHPVLQISWHDAVAYAKWAGARLPTEAEWEKAARGLDGRAYPWGDWLHSLATNKCGNGVADPKLKRLRTTPVGYHRLARSPYGTYDQAGNAWEWVHDVYDARYYARSPSRDPTGPAEGPHRVLRGGSHDNCREGFFERCAARYFAPPGDHRDDYGFRLAMSLQPPGPRRVPK